MRILFLTHSFNSLTQRLYAELSGRGHEVSIEFDIANSVAEEAVAQFQPDLIVAPFLKRAIPASIWSKHLCLIVHPGIVGDRGPSALDWAIQEGETSWGVTVLQAEVEMDAGPVWATAEFPLRGGKKASVYRNEVTEAACRAVLLAVQRLAEFSAGRWAPLRLSEAPTPARGRLRQLMKQADRAIDWQHDDSASVLRKINAGDGFPGVADVWFDVPCHVFDAWPEARLRGTPGQVMARRETALLRATRDGAVWVEAVWKRSWYARGPTRVALIDMGATMSRQTGLVGAWRAPREVKWAENWAVLHQAATRRSASIAPLGPYMVMIRRRLYASTCKLISVCTRGRVFVRKCVAPIQDFSVPNTCSTVLRR